MSDLIAYYASAIDRLEEQARRAEAIQASAFAELYGNPG